MATRQSHPAEREAAGAVDLAVIIVSYNTRDILEACLASIRASGGGVRLQTYVVDNASRDGSAAMVREKFPEVDLRENTENVGFARANSQVLNAVRSRYALLLNSDTSLPPGSRLFEAMVRFMDDHPDIGALGPRIVFPDGSIQLHCARSFPTLWTTFCQLSTLAQRFPQNRLTGRYLMSWWDHESARDVDVLLGACMLVRGEVIATVGGLDDQFFLGGEDVDWCRRIKKAGWKVHYNPDFTIVHHGGASKAEMAVHESRETHIAYYKYFRKHYGLAYAAAARTLTGLFLAFWIGIYGLQYALRPGERARLRAAIRMRRDILAWCVSGGWS